MLDLNFSVETIIGALIIVSLIILLLAFMGGSSSSVKRAVMRTHSNIKTESKKRKLFRQGLLRDLTISEKLRQAEKEKKADDTSLAQLLRRSGKDIRPSHFRIIFAVIGMVLPLLMLVNGIDPIYSFATLIIVVLFGPSLVAKQMVKKYQKHFTQYLSQAVDTMVRGVRTGLPIAECIKMIGNEIPDPVGKEFRMVSDTLMVGVPLDQALDRLHDRVPTAEVHFFKVALVIQQQTGGNLSEALSNLSHILRERFKLQAKVRALSAEARSGAIIIGALPFAILAILANISSEYIDPLFNTTTGQYVMAGTLIWMTFGIIVMRSMTNLKQ